MQETHLDWTSFQLQNIVFLLDTNIVYAFLPVIDKHFHALRVKKYAPV